MLRRVEVLLSGTSLCYAFAGSVTVVYLPTDYVYAIAGSVLTEGTRKLLSRGWGGRAVAG